jgi:hypothetical protein
MTQEPLSTSSKAAQPLYITQNIHFIIIMYIFRYSLLSAQLNEPDTELSSGLSEVQFLIHQSSPHS